MGKKEKDVKVIQGGYNDDEMALRMIKALTKGDLEAARQIQHQRLDQQSKKPSLKRVK